MADLLFNVGSSCSPSLCFLRHTARGCLLRRRCARPSPAMVRLNAGGCLARREGAQSWRLPAGGLASSCARPYAHLKLTWTLSIAVLDSTSGKPAPEMRIRLDRLNTTGFVLQAQG